MIKKRYVMKDKRKRIGVLTFHYSNNNFGAVLQTYASFNLLRNLGYSPVILNLLPTKKISFINKLKIFIASFINASRNFNLFRLKNLKLTEPLYSFEDCKNQNKNFDIFYVGSDQVWRPVMAQERLYRYFLDFVEKGKTKISYAASFGVAHWEGSKEETLKVSELLSQFDAISVREESGVSICKNHFDVNSFHVLDPTLLLDQEDYNELLHFDSSKGNKKSPYAAFYLLSDLKGCKGLPNQINKQLGVPTFNLYGKTRKILGKNLFRFNTVEEWLNGIRDSDYIITDSYHCVIFSIIYKKRFVCIVNEKKGVARIKSLLSNIKLEDRICYEDNIDFNLLKKEVDYEIVKEKLDILKTDSLNFLISGSVNK
ncbi:polysaccharide pyruvyl transferase family protein [Cyclobacteriaceae bacterium YHN15]|nr:polysaccharide pyruvyl transferase family protein [Cyclobacteriaceae bacterium YHN15]